MMTLETIARALLAVALVCVLMPLFIVVADVASRHWVAWPAGAWLLVQILRYADRFDDRIARLR